MITQNVMAYVVAAIAAVGVIVLVIKSKKEIMKKFTTKQLAIAFVAIAFVFIFGFTAYRGITGQFQSQPTISKAVKK